MSNAVSHRRNLMITDIVRWFGNLLNLSDRVLVPGMELVRRITIGQIFLSAAIMKYTDWARGVPLPDESTTLGFINGLTYTYVGVGLEILAAVLLMLGLMTRFAALALLCLAIIAQIAGQASNTQVFWIILFGYWCVNGAGRSSLDYML
ncbi:MAG: DoxX family membrane protein, partial [Rickettsiales bacterium]|nr:DoxX family membrane protein [Rickettsiales bacterium]